MDHIKTALNSILKKDLNVMKENISAALSVKAAEKLEEKKTDIAHNYFAQNKK